MAPGGGLNRADLRYQSQRSSRRPTAALRPRLRGDRRRPRKRTALVTLSRSGAIVRYYHRILSTMLFFGAIAAAAAPLGATTLPSGHAVYSEALNAMRSQSLPATTDYRVTTVDRGLQLTLQCGIKPPYQFESSSVSMSGGGTHPPHTWDVHFIAARTASRTMASLQSLGTPRTTCSSPRETATSQNIPSPICTSIPLRTSFAQSSSVAASADFSRAAVDSDALPSGTSARTGW